MNKYIKIGCFALCVLSFNASALSKMIYSKIDNVDIEKKLVTIGEKTYPYQMLGKSDQFYLANGRTKSFKLLSKFKKYYIQIEFDNASVDLNERVVYVGEIKYAF